MIGFLHIFNSSSKLKAIQNFTAKNMLFKRFESQVISLSFIYFSSFNVTVDKINVNIIEFVSLALEWIERRPLNSQIMFALIGLILFMIYRTEKYPRW